MNYSVDLSDSAIDEIRPLPANFKRRIENALDRIGDNPRLGKPLKWDSMVFGRYALGTTALSTRLTT